MDGAVHPPPPPPQRSCLGTEETSLRVPGSWHQRGKTGVVVGDSFFILGGEGGLEFHFFPLCITTLGLKKKIARLPLLPVLLTACEE